MAAKFCIENEYTITEPQLLHKFWWRGEAYIHYKNKNIRKQTCNVTQWSVCKNLIHTEQKSTQYCAHPHQPKACLHHLPPSQVHIGHPASEWVYWNCIPASNFKSETGSYRGDLQHVSIASAYICIHRSSLQTIPIVPSPGHKLIQAWLYCCTVSLFQSKQK